MTDSAYLQSSSRPSAMDTCIKVWLAHFILTLADVLGAPVHENLTARAGGEITLKTGLTGLQGDYLVLWYSNTINKTLVHCDKGENNIEPPKRFEGRLHHDTTGALTIRHLNIEDNGVYWGQVIDGNHKKTEYNYTVTVLEAAATSPNTAQRNHWAVVFTVLLFVAVCIELFS